MLDHTWLQHGEEILALALLMSLLSSQLPLSHDWLGGNGSLVTEECNSIPVKFSTTSPPPVEASENSYFSGGPRAPLS